MATEKVVQTQEEVDLLNKQAGNTLVKPQDPVTVEWTASATHHAEGTTSTIHRVQAERLAKRGVCKIKRKRDE
jgi:hypothetical protein